MNDTRWTVYKNSEFGFEISIPENFKIQPDPYGTIDATGFNYSIIDPYGLKYLGINAYNKPIDYEEPTGPFPKITSNEKFGATTIPYTFNGMTGYKTEGAVEGAGGSFDYFEFIHEGKVWNIEFYIEHENYPEKSFNKEIYSRIRDSFKLLNSSSQ